MECKGKGEVIQEAEPLMLSARSLNLVLRNQGIYLRELIWCRKKKKGEMA